MQPVALVVDDDPGARKVLGAELESAGFSVREAEDGLAGWKRFSEREPDLVVTELRMPRLDGLGLIRRIRSEARSWVPVIAITSHQDREILSSVFQAGQGAATHFLHLRGDLHRLAEVARCVLEVDVQQLREQRRNLRYHDLRRALQECKGVISRVAERMGTDRKTVYYHLKRFGLYRSGSESATGQAKTGPGIAAGERGELRLLPHQSRRRDQCAAIGRERHE